MSTSQPTFDQQVSNESVDLSLVLGGPLFQLWRRTHLVGDAMELLVRRIIVFALLTWTPLLLLSLVEGNALGGGVALPFFHDIEMHARLLLALPLLLMAELLVHQRIRIVVRQFVDRGLIPDAARTRFDAAIASAIQIRNSMTPELSLIAFVYVVGVGFGWRTHVALGVKSWYGSDLDGGLHLTMAGWWLGCVSLPLFQFLLLRWYFRFVIWARFLWQVSRIQLNLMPMHPDRSGGLGFLSGVTTAFAPVLVAQGTLLAGLMANRIFYAGARLPEFKMELSGLVAVILLVILAPLLFFSPQLSLAKRTGMREYGALAQRYAREFDHKWLRGGAPANESLIGSADIQALADLGNSYDVVREMRAVPFSTQTVLQMAVTTLLPTAPLLLTMIPLEELLKRLLTIVF